MVPMLNWRRHWWISGWLCSGERGREGTEGCMLRMLGLQRGMLLLMCLLLVFCWLQVQDQ